jgi:hypothetical protein
LAIYLLLAVLYGWFTSAGPSYTIRRMTQQWPSRYHPVDPKSDELVQNMMQKGSTEVEDKDEDWQELEGQDKGGPSS